jgi:hypothetical protein
VTRVSASVELDGTVPAVEQMWFDTNRWRSWVEGLESVESVSLQWPAAGAVVWRSGPAGRGRVTERVVHYAALDTQTVAVTDDAIEGEQTVAFVATGDGRVEATLSLGYRIRRRNPLTPLVDWLFVRGAMRRSLEMTLSRFVAEVSTGRGP